MSPVRKCVFAVYVSILGLPNLCAGQNPNSAWEATLPSLDDEITPVEKRVIELQDMFSLLDLGGMSVSPDGNLVAFQIRRASLEDNNYDVGWYVLDLTKGNRLPTHVGEAGDPQLFRGKIGNRISGYWASTVPVWSPDSRWIAYQRMDDGIVQIWRSSVDGTVREQLTYSEAGIDAFLWSEDGRRIWFETDAKPQEQAEYLRKKLESGVWAGDENFDPAARSNPYMILPYEANSGQPTLWALDLSSSQARQASEEEVREHFESNTVTLNIFNGVNRAYPVPGRPLSRGVAVSGDGTRLAWTESQVKALIPSVQVYARLGRANGPDIRCEYEECRGRIGKRLWWSRDGLEVVFRRQEGPNKGRGVFYAWSIDDNALRKVYVEDSRHLSGCSSTGHSLICFSDEAATPRMLVEVKFADGLVNEVFDPNPWFDQILVGEAELIEWGNDFGFETYGWVIKPVGYEMGKRYPLVIVQYRASSCFKGGTGAEYPAHLFAAEGFVVLCFDQPLLHDVFETAETLIEYERAAWKDYYEKRIILSSLESAIDLLNEKGLIDPTKVGITGLSSGVDTISYALSHSDRFGAAIGASLGWSPIAYIYTRARAKEYSKQTGFGLPGTVDDKYWSGMSLSMNASKVQTPILVQVSDNEAPSSMFNYVTFRENGKPIDMYVFADEYHIKWHPRNKKAVAVRAVDWMRFWLKGEEDADPAKAEQYAHWRLLCEQHVTNLQSSEDPELRGRAKDQPCSRVTQ